MCSHQILWGKPPLRRPYLRHCMNSCPNPSRGFWKWQACSFHLAGVTSCVGCRHVSADDQRTTSPTKQIFKLLNLNYFLPVLAILFIQKAVFEKYAWLKRLDSKVTYVWSWDRTDYAAQSCLFSRQNFDHLWDGANHRWVCKEKELENF